MPHSRQRHKTHPHPHPGPSPAKTRKRSAAILLALLMALFGVIISLIAAGPDFLWMSVGAAIGLLTGFLVGRNIDRSAGK